MRRIIGRASSIMLLAGLAGVSSAQNAAPVQKFEFPGAVVTKDTRQVRAPSPAQTQPAPSRAPDSLRLRESINVNQARVALPPARDAPPSIETVRRAIGGSPVFLAEVDTAAVMKARSDVVVSLSRETAVNLSQMLRETALDRQTGLDSIDQAELRNVLGGAPRFEDTAFIMEDRLVVMQTANIPFSADTCDAVVPPTRTRSRGRVFAFRGKLRDARLRQFLEQECFTVGEQGEARGQKLDLPAPDARPVGTKGEVSGPKREVDLDAELAGDVAAIRAELAAARPDAEYVPGISVREARALSDEALLALELNATERIITHLTVLPYGEAVAALETRPGEVDPLSKFLVPVARDKDAAGLPLRPLSEQLRGYIRASSPRLAAFDRRIRQTPAPTRIFTPRFDAPEGQPRVRSPLDDPGGLGARSRPDLPVLSQSYRTGEVLDQRYRTLLMGKSVVRHFGDDYRLSFGRGGRWHVGFEWWAGYGYGLRFPFELYTSSIERFRSEPTFRDPSRVPLDTETLEVEVAVRGIERTRTGASPYADAGLPREEHVGDSEIFLSAYAGCRLYGRVPIVKSFSYRCPGSFSIPRERRCDSEGCDPSPKACEDSIFCHHYIPRLQRAPWSMAAVTVPSSIHRLEANLGIVRFGADPGVEAFALDTRLAMTAVAVSGEFRERGANACSPDALGLPRSRLLGPGECRIVFDGQRTAPVKLAVVPDRGRDAEVRLADPRLDLTVGLSPFIEAYAVFDIKVWKKRWSWRLHLGQVNIDASFGAHDGTRSQFGIGDCKADGPASAECAGAVRRVETSS